MEGHGRQSRRFIGVIPRPPKGQPGSICEKATSVMSASRLGRYFGSRASFAPRIGLDTIRHAQRDHVCSGVAALGRKGPQKNKPTNTSGERNIEWRVSLIAAQVAPAETDQRETAIDSHAVLIVQGAKIESCQDHRPCGRGIHCDRLDRDHHRPTTVGDTINDAHLGNSKNLRVARKDRRTDPRRTKRLWGMSRRKPSTSRAIGARIDVCAFARFSAREEVCWQDSQCR